MHRHLSRDHFVYLHSFISKILLHSCGGWWRWVCGSWALGCNQCWCCAAAAMSLFWGIPAACELCCAAEHMQWSRQEDGSWLEFARQETWKEPSWQHLIEEIRELIFNRTLKKKNTWEKKKSQILYTYFLYLHSVPLACWFNGTPVWCGCFTIILSTLAFPNPFIAVFTKVGLSIVSAPESWHTSFEAHESVPIYTTADLLDIVL